MTVTAETPAETDAAYRKLRYAVGLSPEPERLSGGCWVNVYEGGAVECYRQRSYADNFQSSCGNPRIACIRIDLSQHRKGEGL